MPEPDITLPSVGTTPVATPPAPIQESVAEVGQEGSWSPMAPWLPSSDAPSSISDPTAPTLGDLYPIMPPTMAAVTPESVTATQAGVTGATAAGVGTPGAATAEQAEAAQVTGAPTDMTAAGQLATITGQDSPLMQQARQQGLMAAAKRGLMNSSIAGAASQAEMVRQATPLAQQDAATAARMAEFNVQQQNQINALNAKLGTDVSSFNADQLNQAERLSAQMETAVSQGNAEAYNTAQRQFADLQTRADLTNADQKFRASSQLATERNQMIQNTNNIIADLNKQYMAGVEAIDLAQINGKYNNLNAQNETAARIFDSYIAGMSQIMANKDIDPARVTTYVQTQLRQVEGALQFMQDLNSMDLGNFSITPGGGYNPEGAAAVVPTNPWENFDWSQYGSAWSDSRLKKNLLQIGTIPVYTWDWTDEAKALVGDQRPMGVLAEELEEIAPDLVHVDPATGFKKVSLA